MTFQEKSRWIELVANLAVWSWYFFMVARALAAGYPDEPYLLALMAPVVVALVVIHIVGHVVAALSNVREAGAPLDERDRDVARRASAWGYNVLCVGVFAVIACSFFWWNSFVIVNALLFAFIVSETVRLIGEITLYRRMAA